MSPDPKLVEIAKAAESGQALPILRLATAAQIIVGRPGPTSDFSAATWEGIKTEVASRHRAGTFTSEKKLRALEDERVADLAHVKEGWTAPARAPELDPPENLTLYGALAWAWGEPSGIRVPAIRVRLEAVNAWWPTPGESVKAASGAGWFGFVSVPLPLGN